MEIPQPGGEVEVLWDFIETPAEYKILLEAPDTKITLNQEQDGRILVVNGIRVRTAFENQANVTWYGAERRTLMGIFTKKIILPQDASNLPATWRPRTRWGVVTIRVPRVPASPVPVNNEVVDELSAGPAMD